MFIRPALIVFAAGLAVILFAAAPPLRAQCDADAVFAKANGLLQSRQYDGAVKALKILNDCGSLSSLQRFEMGWLYGRARHFAEALRIFDGIPQNVPDLVTHNYAVALSKFELGDYRGATKVLQVLRSQTGFDAKCANLLAVSFSKLGEYQDAFAVLEQEIRERPSDLSAYLNMVTVCAEGGDIVRASAVATDASRLFPQSAEVQIVRGAANILLGHLDLARNDFSSAVGIAPQLAEPRFFLGLTAYKSGEYTQAVRILQAAIDSGIVDSDVFYLLAECLLKIDPVDQKQAIAVLNRAIEVNGDSVSARTLRGRLLLDSGRAKEAMVDLELANRLDGASRSAAYNLARAYRAAGRTTEAKALFERLRSDTGDTLAEFGDKRLNQTLKQNSSYGPQ